MDRSLRRSALVAAFAAVLFAAPAFAQKAPSSVPVTETEKPARTAVQIVYTCPPLQSSCTSTFEVPAGMRLVVESIIGKTSGNAPNPGAILIWTQLNGDGATTWLFANSALQHINGWYSYPLAASVRLYSDDTPSVSLPSAGGHSDTDGLTVFGYLVKK